MTLTSSEGPPGLWGEENIKVPEFRERPSSRPLKTQQSLTEGECACLPPRTRSSGAGVRLSRGWGTLMSHLIPGVDSLAPGPGLAPELAYHLSLSHADWCRAQRPVS